MGSSPLEGFRVSLSKVVFSLAVLMSISGCSSSLLKSDKAVLLQENTEFDKAVKIVKEEPPVTPEGAPSAPTPAEGTSVPAVKESAKKNTAKKAAPTSTKKTQKKGAKVKETAAAPTPTRRQPELEDDKGFDGRRPLVDPFTVGETVVHDVNYFKVSAGELRLMVKPFAFVNGRKSYNFVTAIKTSKLFNAFYSVDDWVETLVDFESLVPSVYEMHVKESGQLRESKMLFDNDKHIATFWEKKITKDNGMEEKKASWEIVPYTQNVFSIFYYMRMFAWETGKEYSFNIAHEEENIVFKGTAIRREVLNTKLGPMKAIVIKPEVTLKGKFKPIGDNYIWLSDDEHKYILRIESKIKIGTLVSEVVEIKK